MHFVEEVTPLADRRTHWVADIVGRREWDAVNEDWIPDRQVGWRSVAGLENSGRVTFEDAGMGRTKLTVRIAYEPPLGVIGDAGEALGAGSAFEEALRHDLENFATMVAQAPAGATDPRASEYLYNPDSALAEGRTRPQWPGQEIPNEFEY
jgi:uncharacterized membrane protein